MTCYFKTTTTCHTLQCNYNIYNYPAPPHPPCAWRVTNIRIINILISRRVTYYLCALNIFVIHRRRSSAFAKKTSNTKKRDELRQKKGSALKSKLHCAELKKPKNAYEPDASGSRRFSKKTCPESKQNTGFREGMSFWPTVLSEPVWIYIYIYMLFLFLLFLFRNIWCFCFRPQRKVLEEVDKSKDGKAEGGVYKDLRYSFKKMFKGSPYLGIVCLFLFFLRVSLGILRVLECFWMFLHSVFFLDYRANFWFGSLAIN